MMRALRGLLLPLLFRLPLALLLFLPRAAHACPVCFGEGDTGPARGIRAAITLMLSVTGVVFIAFAAVIVRIRRRSGRGAA
jgi:hypothetical protein